MAVYSHSNNVALGIIWSVYRRTHVADVACVLARQRGLPSGGP